MRAIDNPPPSHEEPDTICTCAAIRQAARRVTRLYDAALAPFGLRITQYPILVRLAVEGPATIGVLADRLLLDRATLGHNLRPLQAAGLVSLEPGTADRRGRVAALTGKGRETLRAARPAWEAAQAAFDGAFGAGDAASLRATMGRVARLEFPDTRA
jgi:DNA-binding MarR family transcriptional regulator